MKGWLALPLLTGSAMTWAALGAHEHGVGDLAVAIEGHRVDLMLTAPTGDLVGLERAPATKAEYDDIQRRIAAIEEGDWFAWRGHRCERVSVRVELPPKLLTRPENGADHDHDHGHDDDDHDDHGHHHDHGHGSHDDHRHDSHDHAHGHGNGHGHDHASHDDHDHEHGHHHDDDAHDHVHLDGMVTWVYQCQSGPRLRRMEVNLFDGLDLQRIRAQVVSEYGQNADRLTPNSRRLALP